MSEEEKETAAPSSSTKEKSARGKLLFWKKKAPEVAEQKPSSIINSNNNNNIAAATSTAARSSRSRERPKSNDATSSNNTTNSSSSTTITNNGGGDGKSSVFRVQIPEGYAPGREFQVFANGRIVRVRCPKNSKPGQYLSITVPADAAAASCLLNKQRNGPPDSPNVTKHENDGSSNEYSNNNNNNNENAAYMVAIPDTVRGGQQFPVTIAGQTLMVTCPPNARPGSKVRVMPPPRPQVEPKEDAWNTNNNGARSSRQRQQQQQQPLFPPTNPSQQQQQQQEEPTQKFEVIVPPGVQAGRPFALLAGGVRILVVCPMNAGPGQRIRFRLPMALTMSSSSPSLSTTGGNSSSNSNNNNNKSMMPPHMSEAALIKLSYDKDGWTRTIRVHDMKFQWIRMDEFGDVDDGRLRFDAEKSAYVRQLVFTNNNNNGDARIRQGLLSLVPASEAAVDSKIKDENGAVVVTYADIAKAQGSKYEEKIAWFHQMCMKLCVEWQEGHMRINVRRDHLLEDSVEAIMSLSRKDLRKLWRFEFIGEEGIDAGGLAREWFQLVSAEMFDPNMGFWQSSEANQMCAQINPASSLIHEDYLYFYRFLGRVMGKALFDRQLIAGHCVQYIYKHILGWPVTLKDIKSIDEEYYNNLLQLKELVDNGEDLSVLCLDFTQTVEVMGVKQDVELVEGGAEIDVTNDNFPEYLEACLKHRMMDRVKSQLSELLLGFFDVVPEPLLTVFDFQELELLMCGLPVIDLEDWRANTEYSGDYAHVGGDYRVCQWFWDVVEEFDQEMKARLLQFVTATSGVPSGGFGVLQGNDGNVRKFTIHGVSLDVCLYPRAHTCFNRIDLPNYDTKEDLREKLKLAVTMVATGFDIE